MAHVDDDDDDFGSNLKAFKLHCLFHFYSSSMHSTIY